AGAPFDPAPVLGRDERCQPFAVVVRRDRRETTPADRRNTGAFRFDTATGCRMVRRPDEVLLTGAHLQRERTLAGLGNQLFGIEAMADLAAETEPVEPAGREHHRVEPPLSALAQPRVDVAPKRLDRERWLDREQLCATTDGGRADPHPGTDRFCAAQRIAWVVPLDVGADCEPV